MSPNTKFMHDPFVIFFKEYTTFPPCFKLGWRSLSSHLPIFTFLLNKKVAGGSPFSNEESWKLIFHIFLKIHSEVVAPVKCAAGGEQEWEVETAAGSNFSSPGLAKAALTPEQSDSWRPCVEKSAFPIPLFLMKSSGRTTCSNSSLDTPLMLLFWRNYLLMPQSSKSVNPRLVTAIYHSLRFQSVLGWGLE